MNQIRVFLRSERTPTLAWSLGLAAYVFLMGAIFASFDAADLNALLENYPEDLLEVFGDIQDFGSVDGFLQAELGGYFALVLGVFAVMLMTKHLAGAEEQGLFDHVLARPITREAYYWQLVAAGTAILGVMLAGAAIGGMIGFSMADTGPRELVGIFGIMFDFLPIGVFYLALGAACGAVFHRRARANILGIVVVFSGFIMDVAARIVEDLDWLAYWTPNGYLSKSNLYDAEPHLGYLAFAFGLAIVLAYAGSVAFDRKDLYA